MCTDYDECVDIMAHAVTPQKAEDINHLHLLREPGASPLSLQDIVEDIRGGSSFLIATHNNRVVGLRVLFHREDTRTGEKGLSEEIMVHEDYMDTDIANELSAMGEPKDPYTSRGWKNDGSGIYRKTF